MGIIKALWDEIIRSDNKEMYKEELRRQKQGRLGRRYLRQTAQRLGVIKPLEIKPDSRLAKGNIKTKSQALATQRENYKKR
ncbi:hypothetical protein C5167_000065 [Papaver somniferum]|uniref:Uncharacterized protein n=1 Tax=Papaver somniferum TaxID=3469 RepID=A0A4Y7KSP3_PAPSO|nr:hypothetical protein C5167_000065 [Papaver somniferum]